MNMRMLDLDPACLALARSLGAVDVVHTKCVVQTTLRINGEDVPDDSGVVSSARPLDDRARARLREQAIARMQRDPVAVAERERRVAVSAGRVAVFRRRAGAGRG